MIEFIKAYDLLLETLINAPRKNKKKIVKAWAHYRKKGHMNGFRAPREIRERVIQVAKAIRVERNRELRASWREDISRTLKERAAERRKKRALE